MLVTTLVLKTETGAEIFNIFYYSSNVKIPLTPNERESEFFLRRLSFFLRFFSLFVGCEWILVFFFCTAPDSDSDLTQ